MKTEPKIMKFKRIFLIITCIAFSGETPYVIMVSFDGFRFDYAEKVEKPNLDYLRAYGIKAESLITVFL